MSSDLIERWLGYHEPTWQERFEELDRRWSAMMEQEIATIAKRVHEIERLTTRKVGREEIARKLCELDGHDPDGGPKRGFGYVDYLDRADAILALLETKAVEPTDAADRTVNLQENLAGCRTSDRREAVAQALLDFDCDEDGVARKRLSEQSDGGKFYRDRADAIAPLIAAPEGFAVVPVEPTREMRDAALSELSGPTDFDPKVAAWDAVRAYRAMIAARPGEPA